MSYKIMDYRESFLREQFNRVTKEKRK